MFVKPPAHAIKMLGETVVSVSSGLHSFAMVSNLPDPFQSTAGSTSPGIRDGFRMVAEKNWLGQIKLRVIFWDGTEVYRRSIHRKSKFMAVLSANGAYLTIWEKATGLLEVLHLQSPHYPPLDSSKGTLLGQWQTMVPFLPGIKGNEIYFKDQVSGLVGTSFSDGLRPEVEPNLPASVQEVLRRSSEWRKFGSKNLGDICETYLAN